MSPIIGTCLVISVLSLCICLYQIVRIQKIEQNLLDLVRAETRWAQSQLSAKKLRAAAKGRPDAS